jgi:hypothetical protein
VDVTERMFASYLDREVGRMGSRKPPGKLEASAFIMKHGPTPNLKSDEFSCVFLRFLPFGDGRQPTAQ